MRPGRLSVVFCAAALACRWIFDADWTSRRCACRSCRRALASGQAPGRALSRVGGGSVLRRPRVFYRREPDPRPLILAVF